MTGAGTRAAAAAGDSTATPAGLRVVHWYPNFLGGGAVANAVAALAEAQARAGAAPLIVGAVGGTPPLYGSLDRVDQMVVRWKPSWTLKRGGFALRWMSGTTRAVLRDLQPDVVHIHAEFNPDNFWALRLFSCPCVLSPHGAFNPVVLGKGRRRAKRAYIGLAKRLAYRRLASFHALSPLERDHVRRLVPGGSVYCVPQGPGPVRPRSREARSAGATDASPNVVTVGRVDVFTKGLDVLVDAYALVAQSRPRLGTLTIVGPDWNGGRNELERRLGSLGIADRVRFTGRVDGGRVGQLLADADIYVQASRHEGFSLAVAEALLAGLPVIMTRENGAAAFAELASLPHVRVVDPEPGSVVCALEEFVDDLEAVQAAARAAQPDVAEFLSWDRIARLHVDAYTTLVAKAA